jgi:uncharacterized protein (UPF0261 family)
MGDEGGIMEKTIVLIGTLDTKGTEYGYIRDRIMEQGCRVIVVDVGILGRPSFQPDITREQVAQAAGLSIEEVASSREEGEAVQAMSKGAVKIAQELYQSGELDGVLSLGGTMGAMMGTAAMRALPLGIPKVMVSTQASGDTSPYVGTKDIVMIPSLADIVGLNRITKNVLTLAAGAVVGMVNAAPGPVPSDKPLIGLTLQGDLMPCANYVMELLEQRGYEVVVLHAVGTGGKTLEEWIEQGLLAGVFDLVTTEILQHIYGGLNDAGPARLEAAGARGIPQLVAPGKADIIAFDGTQGIPEHLRGRKLLMHTPIRVVARTTREERAQMGRVMAEKLNKAIGPTAVIIPKKGFSGPDKEGNDWHDPEANLALIEALKRDLKLEIKLVEVDAHINDKLFAETAAMLLDELMQLYRKA